MEYLKSAWTIGALVNKTELAPDLQELYLKDLRQEQLDYERRGVCPPMSLYRQIWEIEQKLGLDPSYPGGALHSGVPETLPGQVP